MTISITDIAYEVRDLYAPTASESLRYVGLEHIQPDVLHLSGLGISSDTQSTKKKFRSGDILFGTLRPYFRKVVRAKFEGVCSTDITVIRAKETIDTGFLFYLIASQSFIDYATATSSGTRMPRAKWPILSQMDWRIPEQEKRVKIAAVLSAYDNLIENNIRRIEILEEMASTVYREWFVEFRFPGHEQVEMVESELGLIPRGWEVKKVEEFVANHIGGGWGKEDNDSKHIVPAYVIRGTDFSEVRHLTIDTCPLRYHTQSNFKSRELKPNDIVMEISGGSKDWGVGRSILVTPQLLSAFNESVICASFCKKLSLDEKTFSPLIFIIYLQEAYKSRNLELYELRSTGIRNFQFPVFLQREQLPVPLLSIQRQFVAQVQPLIDSIQNIGAKNTNLRQTRDLLLPKLISGEIDVSELDIDID